MIESLHSHPRESYALVHRPRTLLTPREREVLALLAEPLAAAGIAKRLCISIQTLKHHQTSIYRLLGVDDRTSAVVTGMRRGLLPLPVVERAG